MAEDVLSFTLYDYERNNRLIPAPSDRSALSLAEGEFVNMIMCDTLQYKKRKNKKAVKKTLSIPEWLNEAATAANVNFSQVLQDALIDKLGISQR